MVVCCVADIQQTAVCVCEFSNFNKAVYKVTILLERNTGQDTLHLK